MIRSLLAAAILAAAIPVSAATWFDGWGNLVSNVCRNGVYYTVYPRANAQPVGSVCAVNDPYGRFYTWGTVSAE